ncbi:MAG: DUF3124 domain-containing protein [Bacteroidales bacterium]|nr:DUF3124 domain-containing protein [Bacteroidales bacterium]
MKHLLYYAIPLLIIGFSGCREQNKNSIPETQPDIFVHRNLNTYLVEHDSSIFYGELIYVPAYSGIHYGDEGKTINLSITLSVHNTDLEHPITLNRVNYHNKKGTLIRNLLLEPVILQPLETRNFVIGENDNEGGTGANFVVDWNTGDMVSSPVIEAIMITTQMNQGISFTTYGRIIKKYGITHSN